MTIKTIEKHLKNNNRKALYKKFWGIKYNYLQTSKKEEIVLNGDLASFNSNIDDFEFHPGGKSNIDMYTRRYIFDNYNIEICLFEHAECIV